MPRTMAELGYYVKCIMPFFVLGRDIVKVGVSIILGTPWVAYEKLKAGISREPSDERPVDNSRLYWVG